MTNQSSDPNLLRGKLCPFLGLDDDRETALSYPSIHNYCYHVKPVISVNLFQQRQFCLSNKFNTCPIYSNENVIKAPEEWGNQKLLPIKFKPWMVWTLLIFSIFVIILVSSLLGLFRKPAITQPNLITTTSTTSIIESYITKQPTIVLFTETPEPTLTDIPTQSIEIVPHMLETPFRNAPQLLVHQVKEGEGFIILAERYSTSVDAIKAVNYAITNSLLYNQILVIPLNTNEVSNLPSFSVYQEQDGGVTIEELADRMQIDAASFSLYNDLPLSYLVSQGEMLLIPHQP
jgi:hypothetical protein